MEKNFERHSAPNDLLSQSYCNGIQKIAGTEDAITNGFHISGKILDKRKKAWNNLFQKYSTMVSEIELNINTLQPEESMNPPEVMQPRLPMRKPMSMVQYWVDTGNLLHTNCTNNPIHSDSGSSIVEDDCSEPHQNNDCQSLVTDPGGGKHSNIAETSGNKNLKIATSSNNSSVDTAAYILANNNITKKAETIAIVEVSKANTEKDSHVKPSPQVVGSSKDTNEVNFANLNNHDKLEVGNADFSQSSFLKSCADRITENLKNANFDKMRKSKINSKSTLQPTNICSIFFSDSDESISNVYNNNFHHVPNEDNQNSDNMGKFLKRKKLYKRSDSPAEFTPVSEDSLSLQTSKMILRKCLPLRRSEHPALDTPKPSSRCSFRAKFRQAKFKRRLNQRQTSSTSTSDKEGEHQEASNPNQNNVKSHTFYNSKIPYAGNFNDQTVSNEDCITNNDGVLSQTTTENHMMQPFLNQLNKVQKPFTHRINSLGNCHEVFKNNFKLSPCRIVVQKLPYKYYTSSSSRENLPKTKNLIDSVKSKNIKHICNSELTANAVTMNDAKDASKHVKAYNVIIFNNRRTFGDILKCREGEGASYKTTSTSCSSNVHRLEKMSKKPLEVTCNETSYKEKSRYIIVKSRYIIADSSSDESDLIVPYSSTKNASESKPRRLTNKHFSDDPCSNATDKSGIQSCSNKQKRILQKIGRNNDANSDEQHNDMKKNIASQKSRDKTSSRDCKHHTNRIKKTLNASSSQEDEGVSMSIIDKIHDKTKTLGKIQNEREVRAQDNSFSSDNAGDIGTLSDLASENKTLHKIPASSPTKHIRRQDASQKTQDSVIGKKVIIRKLSTKKRKSLEIDLSSDEECIVPLKKKE